MHQEKAEIISHIIEAPLNHMGYDLVRVLLSGESPFKLQVMIDRLDKASLTMDDCVKASHHISSLLDVEDPIEEAYDLEVSSPGLDRPLTRLKDFKRFLGEKVKLKTIHPLKGQKRFKGKLTEVMDESIKVVISDQNESVLEIKLENIQKAHLIPDFDYFEKDE